MLDELRAKDILILHERQEEIEKDLQKMFPNEPERYINLQYTQKLVAALVS